MKTKIFSDPLKYIEDTIVNSLINCISYYRKRQIPISKYYKYCTLDGIHSLGMLAKNQTHNDYMEQLASRALTYLDTSQHRDTVLRAFVARYIAKE